MSTSNLYRLSGFLLILASVLLVVSSIALTVLTPESGPDVSTRTVTSAAWSLIWLSGFIGSILLLFGLIGLFVRQAQRGGIMGLLGFFFTFLGFLFVYIVAGFFFGTILPYLAAKGATSFADPFLMVMPYGLVGGLLTLVGTILLGITIIRAKIFPRLTGIFLIVGGILNPASILGLNLIVSLLGIVSIILLALGFAWIGSLLFSQSEKAFTVRAGLSGQE
jgi:hypothetical protein